MTPSRAASGGHPHGHSCRVSASCVYKGSALPHHVAHKVARPMPSTPVASRFAASPHLTLSLITKLSYLPCLYPSLSGGTPQKTQHT